MKTVSVKQIQKLDDIAINQYGVPSLVLMKNAGKAVADEIIKVLRSKRNPRVCVVCGLGNNAGDGFVVARHLVEQGIKTDVYVTGDEKKLKNDAAVNYNLLKKLRIPVKSVKTPNAQFQKMLNSADMLVDAIFGMGLSREIKDPFLSFINAMNASQSKIIAVDVPSGLDGTSGNIYGVCIKAVKTVTFSFAKKGFYRQEGPKYVGKVKVADIGIPQKIIRKVVR